MVGARIGMEREVSERSRDDPTIKRASRQQRVCGAGEWGWFDRCLFSLSHSARAERLTKERQRSTEVGFGLVTAEPGLSPNKQLPSTPSPPAQPAQKKPTHFCAACLFLGEWEKRNTPNSLGRLLCSLSTAFCPLQGGSCQGSPGAKQSPISWGSLFTRARVK